MADVKISALPAASTLAGANVLPLVQGASTTKVSLTQLDTRWVSPSQAANDFVNVAGDTMTGHLKVPSIAAGPGAVAGSGAIRLGVDQFIVTRNETNTADINLLGYGSFGAAIVTQANAVYIGSGTGHSIFGASIRIGTNPAQTGAVRLPNNQAIVARNAANDADIEVITVNAGNAVRIANAATLSTRCFDVGANSVVIVDSKDIQTGTTTGTRIAVTASQKLGFYGATPVVRPTGTPAAATDPATTMALVNSLRASLIALGLIS